MVIIPVKIEAKSPINVGARRPYGYITETTSYIPAGVIRGSFATFLHRGNPSLFASLFQPADVLRFSDFYPVHPFIAYGGLESRLPSALPVTAVTCKHYPGFRTQQEYLKRSHPQEVSSHPVHGVFDTLLVELAYDLLRFPQKPLRHLCPCCREVPAEEFEGHLQALYPLSRPPAQFDFASHRPIDRGIFFRQSVDLYHLGRTAINRARQTVQEGMLYALAVIPEGTTFMGWVGFPAGTNNSLHEQVLDTLKELSAVGADATAGLGQVSITTFPQGQKQTTSVERVEECTRDFNQALHLARTWCLSMYGGKETGPDADGVYFTVDLQSPAVFFGKLGEPTVHLTADLLSHYCKGTYTFQPVATFVRHQFVGGWSLAWQLPKEMRLAVQAGSVFVFKVKELTSDLLSAFTRLEEEGMGEYREEGFGQVRICHPFHLEVLPV
ncbi:MAG: CRISPR-associated RAMP protein Csx10 [Deltaproteobacteria bacterium]|nr:CRISPR-associated RAMP protein Csx10 [Deltaproteobacteria bacterium]